MSSSAGGGSPGTAGSGGTTAAPMNPPPTPGAGTGAGGASAPVALDPGRIAIHRLNNLEYDNTVMDLLGVPGMARATFQPDEKAEFDNSAEALTLSDTNYAQYLDAAESLSDAVFASPALKARILTCVPSTTDMTCATDIATKFGMRAWRRPLQAAEIKRLVGLAQEAIALGESAEGSIQHVVRSLLVSIPFLYRIEYDPDPASLTAHAVNPYELATRLSYLAWSSMPDDTLFQLADSGQLAANTTVLSMQLDRVLADPRAQSFTQSFAGQWLGARDMQSHQVEPTAFPATRFDEPLRAAMIAEVYAYFNEFLAGSLPMTQFFTADENFVDARLAQHYGFPAPTGAGVVKVTNTTDARVGFMGLASFLTMSSFAYRTAPTERGLWVLENLLCQDVPPPPPDVPQLDANGGTDVAAQTENVRVRLAAHRSQVACAACHAVLDPIGLGLENFDAIGAYRTTYANNDVIDSSGMLPTGETFSNLKDLATILSSPAYTTKLTDCASSKLMTYALSRSLVASDQPYLDQVRSQWAAVPAAATTPSYSLKTLMKQIVLNDTFRYRRGEP